MGWLRWKTSFLVAAEDVAGVDAGADVVEEGVVTVGDDGLALFFEFRQIVYHFATEEQRAVLQRWFVNYHFCAFCLDALHYALYRTLTEVVAVGLHGQAEHSDCDFVFATRIPIA